MQFRERFLPLLLWGLIVLAGSSIRLNVMVGEGYATFSWLMIMLPMTFLFFPLRDAGVAGGGIWLLTHLSRSFSITLGIPTLFASLSWVASKRPKSLQDALMHVLLPLTCIGLFCFSPTGSHAKPYSLYWCIPIALYLIPLQGVFDYMGRALKSTFVAHALGSVIWVYCVPMSSAQWLALIPVVAIERLAISLMCVVIALTFAKALKILSPNTSSVAG
ncbi:hypothetical protein ACFLR2_00225 [Chlamydiota bacterium]